VDLTNNESSDHGTDLAGSRPIFPGLPGNGFDSALSLPDFRHKRLIFNQLVVSGQMHVYSANCRAGARLRAQLFIPQLGSGRATVPNFAIVAQSLPYSADIHKLPIEVPAGFSAVVAPPMGQLGTPVTDLLTQVKYNAGSSLDTQTIVGGRAYIIVWSPEDKVGKYVLQTGHQWPLKFGYWIQIPWFWWQIRGWFGRSRAGAIAVATAVTIGLVTLFTIRSKRQARLVRREEI